MSNDFIFCVNKVLNKLLNMYLFFSIYLLTLHKGSVKEPCFSPTTAVVSIK